MHCYRDDWMEYGLVVTMLISGGGVPIWTITRTRTSEPVASLPLLASKLVNLKTRYLVLCSRALGL